MIAQLAASSTHGLILAKKHLLGRVYMCQSLELPS
jgi:hypothetical protein